MVMKNILKDYREKFGEIPIDFYERFIQVLRDNKISDKDLPVLRQKIYHLSNKRYKRLYFIFFLEPSSCPRPRLNGSRFKRGGKKSFVFVKGAKEHKDIFDEFIETVGNYPLITTPVKFHIETFVKTPSSMGRIEKVLAEMKLIDNISRPDFDNYEKRYADMIQETLIFDDCLIVESSSKKKYSCKPRIEICIEYATEHDCSFNEKKMNKRSF